MIVQPLPGGSIVLDAVAVEVVYMTMVAGQRQLRVDGLSMPAEVRAVLSSIGAQVKATRGQVTDVRRREYDDPPPSDLMTAAEAAPRVGRSERTLERWASSGRLPSARQSRPGAPWLLSLSECQEAVNG